MQPTNALSLAMPADSTICPTDSSLVLRRKPELLRNGVVMFHASLYELVKIPYDERRTLSRTTRYIETTLVKSTDCPTASSYYDFNGTPFDLDIPTSQTWMYARDARAQQAGAFDRNQQKVYSKKYASAFRNQEKLVLSTPGAVMDRSRLQKWLHTPLIPGRQEAYSDGVPGAVRSVWTQGNMNEFDVVYHDPKAGKTGKHFNFSKATYYPKKHRALDPVKKGRLIE